MGIKKLKSGVRPFVKQEGTSAPYTTIQNRAPVGSPLKAIFGNERIHVNSLNKLIKETGPNGEPVFEPDNGDSRVRFIGEWVSKFDNKGTYIENTAQNNTLEVTFYGTGLNLLFEINANLADFSVSVDGVAFGPNVATEAYSSALSTRNYKTFQNFSLASGLIEEWHTVTIRDNANVGGLYLRVYGFEILNELADITVLSGSAFSNGYEYSIDSNTVIPFATGFENISDVNIGTKGGRSVLYIDPVDVEIKKRFTKTDPAVTIGDPTELTTNGTFDTDTDWVKTGSSTISGGEATTPNSSSGVEQDITTVIGQDYIISYQITAVANNGGRVFVDGSPVTPDVFVGLGNVSFKATGVTTTIKFQGSGSSSSATWDNISVKEQAFNFLALTDTDHSEEAPYREINFREFGRNRGDDFSTLGAGASDRAFTLDDGSTTLVGDNVGVYVNNALRGSTTNDSYTLTFFGSGLSIERISAGAGAANVLDVYIDDISVGLTDSPTVVSGEKRIQKICSGLPLGTHTIKFVKTATGGVDFDLLNFIIYQPKKPILPEGAIEIAEYNLLADYVANTTYGLETIATGVLRKFGARENVYTGPNWNVDYIGPGAVDVYIGGAQWHDASSTTGSFKKNFIGSGFEMRFRSFSGYNANARIKLNGVLLTAANFPTAVFSWYGLDNGFDGINGTLDYRSATQDTGAGFSVSGLPHGNYEFEIDKNGSADTMSIEAFDIITPIHSPHTTFGSRSLKDLRNFDNDKSVNKIIKYETNTIANFSGITSVVSTTKNISQMLFISTGKYLIYFEECFNEDNGYVNTLGGRTGNQEYLGLIDYFNSGISLYKHLVAIRSDNPHSGSPVESIIVPFSAIGKLEKDELEE